MTLIITLKIGYNNAKTCIIGKITTIIGVTIVNRILNKKYNKSKFRCPSFVGNLLFSLAHDLSKISFIP